MKIEFRNFRITYILLSAVFLQMISITNIYSSIPPPWQYRNTGNNHTILILESSIITLNNQLLDSGNYIGVFYDSLGVLACGGYVHWINSTTSLTAWGTDNGLDGFVHGETFKFKIWDSSKGKEYLAVSEFNEEDFPSYNSYASNGMSGIVSIEAYPEQNIKLKKGWNFFSSYISPINSPLDSLIQQLNSELIIITDFENEIINTPSESYYFAGDS